MRPKLLTSDAMTDTKTILADTKRLVVKIGSALLVEDDGTLHDE